MPVTNLEVEELVKRHARDHGFDLVRITTAEEFSADRDITLERIQDGHMDGLPWFNESRVRRGAGPATLLPGARSIICLGMSYLFPEDGESDHTPNTGKVARYARLRDYHRVMKRRMRALAESLSDSLASEISARWYVDDGPMLDRAAANRSGLGWFGKNTNILTPSHGSWVFLGQLITDLELTPDPPLAKTCGSCVRCIDACPTGAIVAPYVIDNTRCISYQTIENRGAIPRELRPQMLDWVFGCDICQEVCPVNRKADMAEPSVWERGEPRGNLSSKQPGTGWSPTTGRDAVRNGGLGTVDLVGLLKMTAEEFRQRFRGTPIMRAKWEGMQRNACVALGNLGDPGTVPALAEVLRKGSPLVRGHAAWALGRIDTHEGKLTLEFALARETDPEVLREMEWALEEICPTGEVGLARPSS